VYLLHVVLNRFLWSVLEMRLALDHKLVVYLVILLRFQELVLAFSFLRAISRVFGSIINKNSWEGFHLEHVLYYSKPAFKSLYLLIIEHFPLCWDNLVIGGIIVALGFDQGEIVLIYEADHSLQLVLWVKVLGIRISVEQFAYVE
jgi:hypothetical protein